MIKLKNTVLIETKSDAMSLSLEELEELNNNDRKDVIFTSVASKSFLACETETIVILIDLVNCVDHKATYDILKYIIFNVLTTFSKKITQNNTQNDTKFKFIHNGEETYIEGAFPFTPEQQKRLVDIAIKKFNKN